MATPDSAPTDRQSFLVAIGTRKGLWLATSQDRGDWSVSEPQFPMQEVPSIAIDTRQGRNRILVGVRSEHWGPTVSHSDDLGSTWIEPEHGAIHFPDGSGAAIERVWQIQPDTADRTGVVWAGCEPISVWKSTDGGAHFELNRGLWNNRHRNSWGAGYGGAAAHSIAVDPSDAAIVHVAMSTGGVYRTTDGGDSWIARNNGISAHFLPDPNPEFGQCVHKITRDAVEPKRLYAQNHHGVYRSDDNGDNWISIAEGLPSDFGFAILSHPRQSGTVWVIPLTADAMRFPPEGKLAVHRTSDAGASWTRFDTGLPQSTYNSVLRDAATLDTADPAGLYLGTRDGMVYASSDEGESFSELASHLPDVLCVRAAVLNG